MMRKLSLFFYILLILEGCRSEKQRVYVIGEVDSKGWANVEVFYPPVIPWVTINEETLSPYELYGTWNLYTKKLAVTPGDTLYLKVDYIEGVATASTRLPEKFEIVSHDISQTVYIPLNSDFTVSWSSANADFYRVHFYLGYEYLDTYGDYNWFSVSKDTCVTSTSITFPASMLFPEDVVSAVYSWGYLYIYAKSGPILEPGSQGNIEGDGIGFFWAETCGGGLDIMIEGTSPKDKEEISKEQLREKWFEKAREMLP